MREGGNIKDVLQRNNISASIIPAEVKIIPFKLASAILEYIREKTKNKQSRTVIKSNPTLCSFLTETKPPLQENMTKNCIYSILCSCGKKYKCETSCL